MTSTPEPESPLPELRASFFLEARLIPDPRVTLHGVVLDVPLDGGVDTLAAYADGTARYINHSGHTIIWEVPEAENPMRPLVDGLLAAAASVPLPATRQPWEAPAFHGESCLATVLTRTGPVTTILGAGPISDTLLGAGVALMTGLIEAAKAH